MQALHSASLFLDISALFRHFKKERYEAITLSVYGKYKMNSILRRDDHLHSALTGKQVKIKLLAHNFLISQR